jgi:hypothetical protein
VFGFFHPLPPPFFCSGWGPQQAAAAITCSWCCLFQERWVFCHFKILSSVFMNVEPKIYLQARNKSGNPILCWLLILFLCFCSCFLSPFDAVWRNSCRTCLGNQLCTRSGCSWS